jgi:DNA polymerase elongation subunit (family B)
MLPELEGLYPEGSDITIMNSFYQYPIIAQDDNGNVKKTDDFVALVYKDNKTGIKNFKVITNPNYTYYKLKNKEDSVDYSRLFIERDKVDEVTVPFRQLEKSIAENTGEIEFYKMNLANRDRNSNRKLHTNPDIFFSDSSIEDHYRFKFANTYTNNIEKISKGFFDIEVDGKFAVGNFVQPGECEINCVSFLDQKSDTVYTLILRNSKNPLIAKFEEDVNNGKISQKFISDFVTENVGGPKKARKYKLDKTKFKILFFDLEIELIQTLFLLFHKCSPDFIEGWNSSAFDLDYIIARVQKLGYDPADILCDPRWQYKVVKNYIDQKNINNLAERGDYTFISGLPVFIDQMIQYASRRKSKIGSIKSFKLDDIGFKEAKVKKLDYHHITDSVTELPWLDFQTFVLYNIMDVVVQNCIECMTNDLEYIFSKCLVNNTSYKKGHRQTVYLINRMAADWYKMGYIIGNNVNKWNEKPPKFLGALVGNPLKTNDYSKLKIDGKAIWICDNLQDYDYKSLYPSITLENNIAPNTQIGKVTIEEQVYDHENLYKIPAEKYSRGGEFIENMVTDTIIEYCKRWFHLAGFKEMIEDIDEYYGDRELGKFSNLISAGFNNGGVESPLMPASSKIESPVELFDSKVEVPVFFFNKHPENMTYDTLYKEREKH